MVKVVIRYHFFKQRQSRLLENLMLVLVLLEAFFSWLMPSLAMPTQRLAVFDVIYHLFKYKLLNTACVSVRALKDDPVQLFNS